MDATALRLVATARFLLTLTFEERQAIHAFATWGRFLPRAVLVLSLTILPQWHRP